MIRRILRCWFSDHHWQTIASANANLHKQRCAGCHKTRWHYAEWRAATSVQP